MTKDENATKSSRGRNRSHNDDKMKPPTKVVIRHLPPTMTEEEFLNHFDPLPKHDFYYFAAADWSLGFGATCRAYITLKNYDDVFLLRDQFDGYVFVDSKGAEYAAIVEFAPFQGLLKNKSRRTDNKVNTIEWESHYRDFVARLEEEREAASKGGECKLEFTLERKKEEVTSTPLLQYLANKKEKRREEKRRQREDEKDRRQQNQHNITKIYSGSGGGSGGGGSGGVGGSGGGGGGGQESNAKKSGNSKNLKSSNNNNSNKTHGSERDREQQDENKSGRSKRRAERNQRRREQFEQRKKEREQENERGVMDKEKFGNFNAEDYNAAAKTSTTAGHKVNEATTTTTVAEKELPEQSQKSSRRESKRYSDKRERNSNNSGRDQDKDKSNNQSAAASTSKNKSGVEKKEEAVNESVMNFILSAANAKEFVPKHLQEEPDQNSLQHETVEYGMLSSGGGGGGGGGGSGGGGGNDRSDRKSSLAEKRIRNKDRPSIAIYQPKARLRPSAEEGDTGANNNSKDNNAKPLSSSSADVDAQKQENSNSKKILRYSQRREQKGRNNAVDRESEPNTHGKSEQAEEQ